MNALANPRADAFERALQTFFVEAGEMVEQMEQCLLALEESPDDRELLNALFRSVHTIKGSGGLFGLEALVRFSHEVETVLERLRSGQLHADGNLGSLLLQCADHIANLLAHSRQHGRDALAPDLRDDSRALVERLAPYAGHTAVATVPSVEADVGIAGVWHISLRFALDSFLHGIDPLATIRYLASLGELMLVETFDDSLPALADADAEACYLGFEIRLRTDASASQLEDALEFVRDECSIHLIPPQPAVERYLELIESLPADAARLGEILLRCGAITQQQLHRALAAQHLQAADNSAVAPLGNILVAQHNVAPAVVDAAVRKQSSGRSSSDETRFFRVQADKLDSLIDVVGELVILSAAAKLQAQACGGAQLLETALQMSRQIEEIRNSALSLRMVAIGESFAKFRRVVRDLSESLGKNVQLEISGGDTELDKSVVERIGDPLLHLVRNALDHGLEPPAERAAAGKPEQGTLKLSAWHDSGSIVIEVRDDGRGIDPQRVLAKARERGLVDAGATPSRDEILLLIFEPGFSTAAQVSDLSGRGVGMDVVKRNIESLRGSVAVSSNPGHGAAFSIRLPLTLAIIDGFLVRAGSSSLVIPLEHVEECIAAHGVLTDGAAVGVMDRRGQPLPVLDVAAVLGVAAAPSARQSIVVVRCGEQRAGLRVDGLLGEQQTVIKPLGELFSRLRFVAGSTILGTGQVALILDVPGLLQLANRSTLRRPTAPARSALALPA